MELVVLEFIDICERLRARQLWASLTPQEYEIVSDYARKVEDAMRRACPPHR